MIYNTEKVTLYLQKIIQTGLIAKKNHNNVKGGSGYFRGRVYFAKRKVQKIIQFPNSGTLCYFCRFTLPQGGSSKPLVTSFSLMT